MRRPLAALLLALATPSLAMAHVGVRPRESKSGAEERYSVRVPTEGSVATTSVRFEIPEGVTVIEVEKYASETFEVEKNGDRIVAITWTRSIPPKESAEFFFRARNPQTGPEIAWRAHQRFADGTVIDWVEPAGGKRPGPTTKLVDAPAQSGANDAASVEAWLKRYDAAFLSKDLNKIAVFYHPDVTIYEGAGINNGWADYRDRHLGPELRAFEDLEFAHSGTKVTVLPGGESAYAVSRYTIKAKMGDRMLDNEGLETLLLLKTQEGWRIRHSHTSGRARRREQQESVIYPVLFRLGSFEITSFGVLVAMAALVGLWLFRRELNRAALSPGGIDAGFAGIFGGLLGAKVWWTLEFFGSAPFFSLLFSRGGLSWFGGFTFGLASGLLVIRVKRLPLMATLAAAAPALAIGHAIGRIGCFMVGDDYGKVSNLPWALAFPLGLPPTLDRVHPTQLYEAIPLFLIGSLLIQWRKKRINDQSVFGAYLLLAGTTRFLIEFVRVNLRVLGPFTVAQIASALAIAVGIWLLFVRSRTGDTRSRV